MKLEKTKMKNIIPKQWLHVKNKLIVQCSWFEDFEAVVGYRVCIETNQYKIISIERNRCSGFFFGSDKDWNERDLYMEVTECSHLKCSICESETKEKQDDS